MEHRRTYLLLLVLGWLDHVWFRVPFLKGDTSWTWTEKNAYGLFDVLVLA